MTGELTAAQVTHRAIVPRAFLGALAAILAGCGVDRLRPVADAPLPAQEPQPPVCLDAPDGCTGPGACGLGVEPVCSDGRWFCIDRGVPAPEVCNGRDDDCDGQTDEGLFAPCYSGRPGTLGVGLCKTGISRCGDPNCYFEVTPQPEMCNGVDDDCDGMVDEGVAGIPGCCSPPEPEKCDGLDNDCNGAIDEGLLDACGHCAGDEPEEIPCNGRDDDCDGLTDEDDPPPFEVAIAVDTSTSNADNLPRQKADTQAAVADLAALLVCARWDVLAFPTNLNGVGGTTSYASNATGVDAIDALGKLAQGPGYREPAYDVLEDLAQPHDPFAVRSIILFEDEEGQSLTGQDQAAAAATLKLFGVQVLTFTARADTFWMLGPTRPLGADIRAEVVAFVRARAGL